MAMFESDQNVLPLSTPSQTQGCGHHVPGFERIGITARGAIPDPGMSMQKEFSVSGVRRTHGICHYKKYPSIPLRDFSTCLDW